jgi:hypothetical protein
LIWAAANTLTLALFGFLYKKGIFTKGIYHNKIFKSFAIVIQFFCLIINLHILNQIIDNYYITTAIGLFFIVLMYQKGLITSILTDQYQGIITYITLIGIIIVGLIAGNDISGHFINSDGGVWWALYSASILLTSPFVDIQMWQRAEVDESGTAFYWGSLFFGGYMCLIFVMSLFQFNEIMNILLLIAALCVTTSTIDSIAVAMHELANKQIGTLSALFVCIFWGVFKEMGIVELWSNFGIYRLIFGLTVLIIALKGGKFFENTKNKAGKLKSFRSKRS